MKMKYKGLTPHNDAQKGEIAKTVLMPGDPLRAKVIAQKYLKNPQLVSEVRGMLAFTGKYKGVDITVMGSGMGIPSMGIYASELYEFYDVENIIRIGSCAATIQDIGLYEIIVATESITQSTYYEQVLGIENYLLPGNANIIKQVKTSMQTLGIANKTHFGKVHCNDAFYKTQATNKQFMDDVQIHNVIGLEMESFALYTNAKRFNKQALTLLSVSDHSLTGEVTTAEERQNSFTDMMELALDVAINL